MNELLASKSFSTPIILYYTDGFLMAGISYNKVTYLSILRGNGLTQAEIANILGVSQQIVSYELKKKREAYFQKFPDHRL